MSVWLQMFLSALVGLLAYWAQHYLKTLYISKRIFFKAEKRVGSRISFFVTNRSIFPVHDASVLITIEATNDDIYTWPVDTDVKRWIDHGRTSTFPPQEPINKSPHRAFIEEGHQTDVRDTHLCWAFSYHQQENPPYLNLWSKESALCALANVHDEHEGIIEVASENAFYDKNKPNTKAMVFLKKKVYFGSLKFISSDSFTVIMKFKIDTGNARSPLQIWKPAN